MGGLSIIKNYSYNSTDDDMNRFMLNFDPNAYEMLYF